MLIKISTWSCLEIRMQKKSQYRGWQYLLLKGRKFKYLGTTLAYQNTIQEKFTSRLKSGNACYHSVQNILSSSWISKNLKFEIYRTIICLLLCMGVKLGPLYWERNVGWECLRIGCWGEYLGLKGTREWGNGETHLMRSLVICTPHPLLFGWSNREEWDGRGM